MAEKNLTKNLTRLIKSVDKLIQDGEKGIGEIVSSAAGLKQAITNIKDTLQKPKDE